MPKSEVKPRGFYEEIPKWTKDKSVAYYQGATLKIVWPVIKVIFLVAIFIISRQFLSQLLSVLVCLIVILGYQDIVALLVPNTIRMPAMDNNMFLNHTKSHVNVMNVTFTDGQCQ